MAAGDAATPLLEMAYQYHEGCPACAVERSKALNPGIPYMRFFHIWIIILVSCLPISSLFPFLYFMIRDLHVAKRVEDIGFYAGFVSTSWAIGLIVGPAISGYLAQFVKQHTGPAKDKSLFKNWPLMSSIVLFCIVSFDDMAYIEIFSLWSESDKQFGGLNFSSEDVGQVLAITGASILIYQTFIYPHIVKVLGIINTSRVAVILSMALLCSYPPMTSLSRPWLSPSPPVAMPHLVRERLFFGDINDAIAALTTTTAEAGGFTHLLSVVSSASISFITDCRPGPSIPTEEVRRVVAGEEGAPPVSAVAPGRLMRVVERAGVGLRVTRMAVPLRDTEEENLLDHLEPCLDFIDEGRKEGNVLVHCFAGVSRSATIIVAYLMRTEQKSLEEALESLKEVNESACPNDGFLEQLKLFEEMGFKVDTSSPLYKRFRLKLLGQSYKIGEKIGSYVFEDDPGLSGQPNSSTQDLPNKQTQQTAYRCKKCRRIIAVQGNVVSHTPGEGESCFQWQNKRKGERSYSKEQDCSSLFVEPLKWMTPVEDGALEGKLSCIHCGARLGYFNWSGIQCNCGSWITPAFQISKSKPIML
uniref:protein-tyrosine-phosphatase n=1 Tax=Oryza glumipatula TaxID=40148 RepID=A0A0E0BNL1_9ORYZ